MNELSDIIGLVAIKIRWNLKLTIKLLLLLQNYLLTHKSRPKIAQIYISIYLLGTNNFKSCQKCS